MTVQGKMRQAVMTGIGKIEMRTADIPKIKPDEALVKVEYIGICGSDLHYFETGRIGDYIVEPPFVLGHECGGTVVEVGADVTHLRAGDRVALEPGKTCGRCEFCREGKYNLCPDVVFFATPPVDGTFQEYVAHEARLCFKLPENVNTMQGALIEPLAVGFHAAMRGGAAVGQNAVVFGAGCIGLVSLLALKAMGLGDVYVVDTLQNRLGKAMELGAAGVVNGKAENMGEKLASLLGGRGCDLAIDTSGAEPCVNQAVASLKKGGALVMVGYPPNDGMMFPMSNAINKELTVKTIFRYRHIYPMAIKAVSEGLVDLSKLVTNEFSFGDAGRAMSYCAENKAEVVKGVIKL